MNSRIEAAISFILWLTFFLFSFLFNNASNLELNKLKIFLHQHAIFPKCAIKTHENVQFNSLGLVKKLSTHSQNTDQLNQVFEIEI